MPAVNVMSNSRLTVYDGLAPSAAIGEPYASTGGVEVWDPHIELSEILQERFLQDP